MKRRYRLTSSKDFQRLRGFGKAVRHPFVVMICLPNEIGAIRIGVVAGKLVGKAVERNRAKRLIRSALQSLLQDIQPGWDLLFIARPAILDADFQNIQRVTQSLLERAAIIQKVT